MTGGEYDPIMANISMTIAGILFLFLGVLIGIYTRRYQKQKRGVSNERDR